MACKKKYKIIAGIDEVGRGPLAGPVIAAAITIQPARQSLRLRPMAGGLRKEEGMKKKSPFHHL